jgi:hypothetical protein
MGSGKGGLKVGERWQLQLQVRGALTPGKTRQFWKRLKVLLKSHRGTILSQKRLSGKARRKGS